MTVKEFHRLRGASPLRSAIKSIIMGDYVAPLSKTKPLAHEMNGLGNNIAFTNCNVFDGWHAELQEDMVVLVSRDKILDVGHKEQMTVPSGFATIDVEGRTIMPGLIDSHVHMCSPFTYRLNSTAIRQMPKQIVLNYQLTAYSGVTTVCDMGGPPGFIKEFTQLADRNDIAGPRQLNSYTLISPRKGKNLGYPSQVKIFNPFQAWLMEGQAATRPNTLEDLKKACYKVKDDGGTHLKTTCQSHPFSRKKYSTQDEFPVFSDDWLKMIFAIGREIGLPVDIHAPYADDAERCVDLAIQTGARIRIQHMAFDRHLNNLFIQKVRDYGFRIIPTVMVFGDSFCMPSFISWLDTANPRTSMLPEPTRQAKSQIQNGIDVERLSGQVVMDHDYAYFRDNFDFVRSNTQRAHGHGVIGFGTDTGGTYTGFFGRICSEIMHYIEFGVSGLDIVRYLTSVNAEINDLRDRGFVRPGMFADLISVDGNPVEDPLILKEVPMVMKGGVFLKHAGTELSPSHADGPCFLRKSG
jgi:imidazolonepropionase-like amidohydrolase